MKRIAARIRDIEPSATLAISAQAKAMQREGKDVISFGAGEPDFPTPDYIKHAGSAAIAGNKTRYTPQSGIPELKQAVAERVSLRTNQNYTPSEVIINAGAKQSIFIALQTLVDPGGEVIVPTPCWVSYPEMIKIAGGVPVPVVCSPANNFIPDPLDVKKTITPKSCAIIINSPSNPTGAVIPSERLAELAKIAEENDLWVISDEIYEDLVYENTDYKPFVMAAPEARKRTVFASGVSKTYAMTGWRIGWAAGPKEVISAMANYQGHGMGNPTSISQWAALAAITEPQDDVAIMVSAFNKRRKLMHSRLSEIPGLICPEPKGAFYCFPDVSSYYQKEFEGAEIGSSLRFCEIALSSFGIALVPGEAFLAPAHVRLSYATGEELIAKGLDRLERFIASIK